ncbi:MAG: MmgE/PrpD family protein [Burkholderiales bacterium]|nr:MmgE/PrpD family protein [Burkholderiales bacterium]
MTITRSLVREVRAIEFARLPAELVELSKQIVLDGLAVSIAGAREPSGLGRIVCEYVRSLGGAAQASVVCAGFKTSVVNAAYANGCLAHALDFDNTWYPLNHPTSPTLPAIMALAQHRSLSGERVIEALVAAFEVQGRLRLAATGMATGKGFHKPGITGVMGATAAAIKLLGLSEQQAVMAFGIAGSRAGSLSVNTGTMTKSSHSGHAARMGVECGLKAAHGWTAADDVFGPGGFFDTFWPGNAAPERLVEGFGEPWRMLDPGVGFKKYPSNYFTHRPIDAILALRRELAFAAEDVESVRVRFPAAVSYVDRPAPATGLDGRFSVQYVVALALLDREITMESFTDERRFAPDVRALLPRIELVMDEGIPGDFDDTYVEVDLALKDGRTASKRMAKLSGWCGNPLSDAERIGKYHQCVDAALGRAAAQRLLDLVQGLEHARDVHGIMDIAQTPWRTNEQQ